MGTQPSPMVAYESIIEGVHRDTETLRHRDAGIRACIEFSLEPRCKLTRPPLPHSCRQAWGGGAEHAYSFGTSLRCGVTASASDGLCALTLHWLLCIKRADHEVLLDLMSINFADSCTLFPRLLPRSTPAEGTVAEDGVNVLFVTPERGRNLWLRRNVCTGRTACSISTCSSSPS